MYRIRLFMQKSQYECIIEISRILNLMNFSLKLIFPYSLFMLDLCQAHFLCTRSWQLRSFLAAGNSHLTVPLLSSESWDLNIYPHGSRIKTVTLCCVTKPIMFLCCSQNYLTTLPMLKAPSQLWEDKHGYEGRQKRRYSKPDIGTPGKELEHKGRKRLLPEVTEPDSTHIKVKYTCHWQGCAIYAMVSDTDSVSVPERIRQQKKRQDLGAERLFV